MPSTPGTRVPGTPVPMHHWQGANGVTLAGDSWGCSRSPLVILLHGGGQTRHSWRNTGMQLAAQGYYVIAFDARGHGDSSWANDGDYSPTAFAEDLNCLIAQLGDRSPALIGASLGGITGLVAAGQGRVSPSALILVDIAPKMERGGFDRVRGFMEKSAAGFDSLDEVAAAISGYRHDSKRSASISGLARSLRIGADNRYYWHWDPAFLASREQDFAHRYELMCACSRQLRCPTLIIRGGSSDAISEESVQEFLELCPHAEYVNIAGAGHMIAGEDNDVFGRATQDFLRHHLKNGSSN